MVVQTAGSWLFKGWKGGVEFAGQGLIFDHATCLGIRQALLDCSKETIIGREAVEFLRGEQHGNRFTVLGDDQGTLDLAELVQHLGSVGLEDPERQNIFGYLQ